MNTLVSTLLLSKNCCVNCLKIHLYYVDIAVIKKKALIYRFLNVFIFMYFSDDEMSWTCTKHGRCEMYIRAQ
jgi:hypothetical protein